MDKQIDGKDNVQNTIKNLQDKIQNIENLIERGSDCIILQYGSHTIKLNKAHENAPKKFRNLIAYKSNTPLKKIEEVISTKPNANLDEKTSLLEEKLILKGSIKSQPKSMRGKPRAKIEVDLRNIKNFQQKRDLPDLKQCPLKKDIENKTMLFEDDIYLVEDSQNYIIRQPIKYGYFNLTQGNTIQDIIDDLYNLTVYGITTKLSIPIKSLGEYYCILIIPDIFQRFQIKALVDMLIRQMGFKGIYLHLESVLASFGANLQQCCVVDVGYEKINITCVDEGVIIPGTYIRKNFGSKDIDHLLLRQLIKRNAYDAAIQLQVNNYGDMQQIEKLKEKSCQILQKDDKLNYLYELHCARDQKEQRFLVQHNDGLYLASNAILESDCFNCLNMSSRHDCFDFTGRLFEMQADSEDNLEELSGGIQLSWYWGSKDKETQFQTELQVQQFLHPDIMIPLDQMIAYSIAQVQDSELRQRLANNILFVGGGTHLVDLVEEVEGLLIDKFQEWDIQEVERVEVKTIIRDTRPIYMQWVGATVLPKTESMNEMWISAQKWLGNLEPYRDEMEEMLNQFDADVDIGSLEKKLIAFAKKDKEKEKEKSSEFGIKHLKERIPFIW